ncbi:hypothetical protein U1Q18_004441 [Sarracenia purpurea var. burkii]
MLKRSYAEAAVFPGFYNGVDGVWKSQFSPVLAWRTKFVEPEVIWLIGTNHISHESTVDVELVVCAVKLDNFVVELCRSRQV